MFLLEWYLKFENFVLTNKSFVFVCCKLLCDMYFVSFLWHVLPPPQKKKKKKKTKEKEKKI